MSGGVGESDGWGWGWGERDGWGGESDGWGGGRERDGWAGGGGRGTGVGGCGREGRMGVGVGERDGWGGGGREGRVVVGVGEMDGWGWGWERGTCEVRERDWWGGREGLVRGVGREGLVGLGVGRGPTPEQQNVKAVSVRHCAATTAAHNCCPNCYAEQSHKDNVRSSAGGKQLKQKKSNSLSLSLGQYHLPALISSGLASS